MKIIFLEETDSTNAQAKALAQGGAEEWTVVVAARQSAGRGRMGRSFFSPEGGLYMSVVLRPRLSAEAALLLTTAAAAAMSRAIYTVFCKENQIKWVNDIYIDGRKVCGILAESAFCGDWLDFAVLGVGVNIYKGNTPLPDELKDIIGFLSDEPSDKRDELMKVFLGFLREYYDRIENKPHLEYYKGKQLLRDCDITVIKDGESRPARAFGIDDDFRLRVSLDGEEQLLSFGEVSVRL